MTPASLEQRWTSEEEEILKNKYGEDVDKLLPNRTHQAIIQRAKVLRLTWKPKKIVNLDSLTEFEKGWLTGIIEGEGTLTINNKRNPRPLLQIANTDLSLIRKASSLLGVGFIVKDARENRNTSYYVIVNAVWSVNSILRQLQPCFVSQRKQELCKLLLRFCEVRLNYFKKKRIPAEAREKIRDIIKIVASLNRKGRHIPALS